jgi:glycosyltransferase involved in cell wall biosynthesis
LRKKVLHVIYSLFQGGAERHVETIATTPSEKYDHLVCSLTSGDDPAENMKSAGIPVFLLEKKFRGDIRVLPLLSRLIKQKKVDILHLHNPPGSLWGTLATVFSHSSIPIIRTEHTPYIPSNYPLVHRFLHSYLNRRSEKIICVSDHVRESFIASFHRWKEKYITIHNGILINNFRTSLSREECRTRFKLPKDAKIMGTIGRLTQVKNHASLIKVLHAIRQEFKSIHLAILGEGKLKSTLRELAADFGVSDSVSFLDPTDHIEIFLGALDLFILPSRREGLPLVVLEAMAAGIPTVASSVGGIPEIISNGHNGYLIHPHNLDEIAGKVSELLKDRERANTLAYRGKETIRDRFSADTMIPEIEKVYDRLK